MPIFRYCFYTSKQFFARIYVHSAVYRGMFATAQYNQIGNIVVRSVAVNVVHHLVAFQFSADVFFHNVAVFFLPATVSKPNVSIPVRADRRRAFPLPLICTRTFYVAKLFVLFLRRQHHIATTVQALSYFCGFARGFVVAVPRTVFNSRAVVYHVLRHKETFATILTNIRRSFSFVIYWHTVPRLKCVSNQLQNQNKPAKEIVDFANRFALGHHNQAPNYCP